jgi:hypothetical protein
MTNEGYYESTHRLQRGIVCRIKLPAEPTANRTASFDQRSALSDQR